MERDYGITEAARWLGITPGLLRRLESEERIPIAHRGFDSLGRYGRRYSETDLLILKSMGVGQGLEKLRSLEDVFSEATR